MKNYRIVSDSFSGYEAQVKYAFFPFKWFQLNDYKGVNTWNTPEEAQNFINLKKAGAYSRQKATKSLVDFQMEFKGFLKTGITNTKNKVWQERFIEYLVMEQKPNMVAGMIMLEA